MAFATLAAAERLLVLGEPVGALLVVSYEQQQFILHTGHRKEIIFHHEAKHLKKKKNTHHWPPCCHSRLLGKHGLQIRAQYANPYQLVVVCKA